MSGTLTPSLVPSVISSDKRDVDLRLPLRALARLALPPRCPGCGAVVDADHRFCAECWGSLRFLGPPWCARCHRPFAFERGQGATCATCLDKPPRHAGINAAVAYGDVARTVALRLKYGGRVAFAETAARLMARLVPSDATLLVPVPLHRRRLWSRGFNQASIIAEAVSREAGIPVERTLLQRHRATPVLRGLGARQRGEAVRAAFRVKKGARDRLRSAHAVLVDDVHTSGATSDACTAVLLRAGAARVTVLCWARVLDGDD